MDNKFWSYGYPLMRGSTMHRSNPHDGCFVRSSVQDVEYMYMYAMMLDDHMNLNKSQVDI